MKTRREFLVTACKACGIVGTAGLISSILPSCKSLQVVSANANEQNELLVPLFKFMDTSQVIFRSRKIEFHILVVKKGEGRFRALQMKCTHESQPLTASGSSIYCASHGSKFDLDGKVVLSPATRNLQSYPTRVVGENVIVSLAKA